MIIEDLITDRTQSDVDYVAELKAKYQDGTITQTEIDEWLDGLKGAYNYTDLNRVGEAVAWLADLLSSSGNSLSVTAKQDWTVSDIPTQEQMDAFLADLTLLKSCVSGVDTEVPSSMSYLTYETANEIEQLLVDICSVALYERSNWEICGLAISGAGGIL